MTGCKKNYWNSIMMNTKIFRPKLLNVNFSLLFLQVFQGILRLRLISWKAYWILVNLIKILPRQISVLRCSKRKSRIYNLVIKICKQNGKLFINYQSSQNGHKNAKHTRCNCVLTDSVFWGFNKSFYRGFNLRQLVYNNV